MQIIEIIKSEVPMADLLALAFFVVCCYSYSRYGDHKFKAGRGGILSIMHVHRLNWMKSMLKRESRLADINAVGNLMRSISFFASTSALLVVGLIGALSKQQSMQSLLESIPFAVPTTQFVWEIKLSLMIFLFVYAFFKFTWSLRQYNYLNVIIAGAPTPSASPEIHENYAKWAAEVSNNAARHFGYGLRAYYYVMAVFAWFLGPQIFMAATSWVVWILYRREFRSKTLENLNKVFN